MVEPHLTPGAHLLLWAFPLVLTAASVVLAVLVRPRPEGRR